MKIKLPGNKKKVKESAPWEDEPIGSTEQVADPEYLDKQRSKHRKNGTLDRYCEMLESQIGSLAMKVIRLSESVVDSEVDRSKEVAEEKIENSQNAEHIKKLRTHIASAISELNEAAFYARDHIE